jgi:hypothetical protein
MIMAMKVEKYFTELEEGVRLTILRGDPRETSLQGLFQKMNEAVDNYVKDRSYNQYIEIHMDNPWTRIIIEDLNKLPFKPTEL